MISGESLQFALDLKNNVKTHIIKYFIEHVKCYYCLVKALHYKIQKKIIIIKKVEVRPISKGICYYYHKVEILWTNL